MESLRKFWRGELPLQDAFWLGAVAIGLVVNIATTAAFYGFLLADRPIVALIFGYGASIPYNVLATVGVWRSADRYAGERKWADAAKLITLVGMIILSVS